MKAVGDNALLILHSQRASWSSECGRKTSSPPIVVALLDAYDALPIYEVDHI